jgi:hypothetical protein
MNGRKMQNEEIHNLYFSPRIIGMIIPRGIGWLGHVARRVRWDRSESLKEESTLQIQA